MGADCQFPVYESLMRELQDTPLRPAASFIAGAGGPLSRSQSSNPKVAVPNIQPSLSPRPCPLIKPHVTRLCALLCHGSHAFSAQPDV